MAGSRDKYKKQCDAISTPDAKRIKFEVAFAHMFLLNMFLLLLRVHPMAAAALCVLFCTPTPHGFVYMLAERAVRVVSMPGFISYAGNYTVLRLVWPCVLLINSWKLHTIVGLATTAAATPLVIDGVFMIEVWRLKTAHAMAMVTLLLCVVVNWCDLGVAADLLVQTGVVPGFIATSLEIVWLLVFSTRMIFNDPRGKTQFKEKYLQYLESARQVVCDKHLMK